MHKILGVKKTEKLCCGKVELLYTVVDKEDGGIIYCSE
jgi:hypothetical protein